MKTELLESPSSLATSEQRTLDHLEKIIEKGIVTFNEVGNALVTIRDQRLYKAEYSTFEDYCRQRWGFSKSSANRVIAATEVARELAPLGAIPNLSEGGMRPLVAIKSSAQRKQVWRKLVKRAGRHTPITATMVAKEIKDTLGQKLHNSISHRVHRRTKQDNISRKEVLKELRYWYDREHDSLIKLPLNQFFGRVVKLIKAF